MKDHFCPIEKEWIGYEGQCNWCGEKELLKKREFISLTDEEIKDLMDVVDHYNFPEDLITYTQAKLKEKNT